MASDQAKVSTAMKARILLVDDEAQIVELGKQIMKRLGYRVTSLTNSTKALEMFRENPQNFDLIITDQTMPNMTGAELATEVLKRRPALPVILCTGFSEALSPEAAADIGIRHYLQKPVSLKALARTVRLVLNEAFDGVDSSLGRRKAAAS